MKLFSNYTRLSLLVACCFLALVSFKAFETKHNPLEKIYTQTDRPFYFPGETIWFKSYIVNTDHTISTISDIVHAELISPKGSVVRSLKLGVKDGYVYGNFDIQPNWLGGIYTLKCYTNWMKNYGEESFFTKKITVQKVVKPRLLLNLKFEKEGYGKSSEVISNLEVKDLKNNALSRAKVRLKLSVKGEVILDEKAVTDQDGKLKPTFKLPDNLDTTDVVLNVLIDHKGTTESISRAVPVVLNTVDLQFLPESGKIIAGTLNKVAFKAINEFGKPADIKGEILTEDKNVISDFESFHDGMGSFNFKPSSDKKYFARITEPFLSEELIELPKVHENGVRFSVTTDSLNTTLDLFSTYTTDLVLEVSNASGIQIQKQLGNQKRVVLPTSRFPMGITKFSIKNQYGHTFAERLVFLNPHKKLHVDLSLDQEIYNTREKVKLKVKTYDHQNKPIPANLSIAVADNKLLSFADDKQDHILSYLLLSSELIGKIHKPDFYLNPNEPKSEKALDYLMLTHGWRNYLDAPIVSKDNAKFLPERQAIQTGTVLNKKGKPTKAHLLLFNRFGQSVLVFDTDDDGSFAFKFNEGDKLTLFAYTDDGQHLSISKTKLVKAQIDKKTPSKTPENKEKVKPFDRNESPLSTIRQKAEVSVGLELDNAMEEVVVVGYNTATKQASNVSVVQIEDDELSSTNASFVQTLAGQVAGLNITNSSGQPGSAPLVQLRGVSSISGNNQPLIIIDGVPYNSSILGDINTQQIETVTVIKDPTASAVYGSRGANGVVVVKTKHGSRFYSRGSKKRLNNKKYNNYAIEEFYSGGYIRLDTPRDFYMPKYESKELPEERTDFRQTIYWNPVVQTNSDGIAELEFYNSDAVTSFKIMAEGIGYNGLLGKADTLYATKKLLNIDLKTPNYMVLNDTISLPITITNETSNPIETKFKLQLPKHLKLLTTLDSTLTIDANNAITKLVNVIPIEKGKHQEIGILVESEKFKDVIKKKLDILSPYFPTQFSISGSTSESFQFELNHAIPNTITSEFTIYTDIVGDVMDGIESLIREPYGCFEQTSSSTYPNIMVLKYLKESGRSNPDIEAKALGFIKKGYRRLKGFETSEGGFEWFGKTPPHETLTAYGILEFTEMKEVYDGVSDNMINRTVEWLLSRRDGKGGFKRSKKGYSSFTSSPTDVANAYIVYALSEVGIDTDFELEYTTAFEDALKSNDTYKMALLALASKNLKRTDHFKSLIDKITNNIDQYGFKNLPVDNTITRSYGNSKTIETTAFALLALMAAEDENVSMISRGIDYLIKQRKYNRFGSTQSTAMALKALINYTKNQKQKILKKNDMITLVVNGQSISKKLKLSKDGKIIVDGFESFLSSGMQTVEVKFNNPKNTFPYNLNINWDSTLPDSSDACPIQFNTSILEADYAVGDNVSFNISVANTKDEPLGMVTAIVGIPSGASAQPWQLKKLLEENKVAYYEVFDNYLVFYWRAFGALQSREIRLDLKAEIAGDYQAPASAAYLYYGDEYKTWIAGNKLKIE